MRIHVCLTIISRSIELKANYEPEAKLKQYRLMNILMCSKNIIAEFNATKLKTDKWGLATIVFLDAHVL